MHIIDSSGEWKRSRADVFWTEIASHDHVVQLYEDDNIFIDSLAGFAGGGINSGDCVIVIASKQHLDALEDRLSSYGVHTEGLISEERFIPLSAEDTLGQFMVDNWPDENLFTKVVNGLLDRAQKQNRRIRAFGEMVATLWTNGHNGATVYLEHLWNEFCKKAGSCVFCAYPKSIFTEDTYDAALNICCAHTKIISGSYKSLTEIKYRLPE